MSTYKTAAAWLLLALSWATYITLTFLTWGLGPAATGVFIQFAAAALVLAVFFGRAASTVADRLAAAWREGHKAAGAQLLAAAAALGLSYVLMVIRRFGFAPSGSDTVFLLSLSPLFVILIVWLFKIERLTLGRLAGAGAAVLGAMAIVGNWERPSSFSPFSRFPLEEGLLVLSAALLAAGIVFLWRLARRHDAAGVVTLMVWAALPLLLLIARIADGWAGFTAFDANGYFILAAVGAVGIALPMVLLANLAKTTAASKVSTMAFLSPIVITLLTGVEQSFTAGVMPTPFLWAPIAVGSVLIITGVVAAWLD